MDAEGPPHLDLTLGPPGASVRTTQTFILRLLVDPAKPDVLRGALKPMPEGEPCPFTDEQALLACLHRLVCQQQEEKREAKS